MTAKDFYPTPEWAIQALIANEPFQFEIWECACGGGAISEVLRKAGYIVKSSDLYDNGYGETGVDFLKQTCITDNVVTNPPFSLAEEFVRKGVELAEDKVALLLRLAFLEGGNRAEGLFKEMPPSRIWVFSERVTFYPAGEVCKNDGTVAFAWFVWDKASEGKTEIRWIMPGFKKKYFDVNTMSKNVLEWLEN